MSLNFAYITILTCPNLVIKSRYFKPEFVYFFISTVTQVHRTRYVIFYTHLRKMEKPSQQKNSMHEEGLQEFTIYSI